MRRWGSVLAAMVVVPLFGFVAGACGDEDDGDATEVFSFVTDDLCEWVSEDEVAEFVAAEFDWDGTADEVAPERGGCQWHLSGPGFSRVSASDVRQWEDFDGNLIDPGEMFGEFADFDPEHPQTIGDGVLGYPTLSDGVVVHNAGFGQFVFWVPPADEYLGFELAVPGEQDVFNDDRFFAVADHFVKELGWLRAQ